MRTNLCLMENDRVRQQAAVASLGQRALMGADLSSLLQEAAELVTKTLQVDCSKILELLPDESGLLLRAGAGWKDGLVGRIVVGAGTESQAGYTLASNTPVIVRDFAKETRFQSATPLQQHGVTSGMSVVIHGKKRPYGVLGADSFRQRSFSEDDVYFLQSVANAIGAAIEWERAEASTRGYQDQLRSLASRLSLAEQEERLRIATAVHDHIAQTLAMVRVKLGALRQVEGAEVLQPELDEIRTLLDETLQSTRSLSFELSPPVLYDLGFVPAVEWLAERMEEQHGIEVSVSAPPKPIELEEGVKVLLFTMVRELLRNVVKHAAASRVEIGVTHNRNSVQVQVADNGAGFDAALQKSGEGFGLFSIRERLRYLGGSMHLDSRPGHGTRVKLTAPLKTETGGIR